MMHTPSESGRSRATQLLQSKMVLNRRSSSTTTGTDPTRDVWGRGRGREGRIRQAVVRGEKGTSNEQLQGQLVWAGVGNVPGKKKRAVKLVNLYNMQQLHN